MTKKLVVQSGQQLTLTGKITGTKKVYARQSQSKDVDISFVIDTTGSMEDKIKALLQTCSSFVTDFASLDINPEYSVIAFGDIKVERGGDTIKVVASLTPNVEVIKLALKNMPLNDGFGNGGESSLEALQLALQQAYRPTAVKVIVLITDDAAHQHTITASEMIQQLKEQEFLVFVISIDTLYYRRMAKENGGSWSEISSTSSLKDLLELFKTISGKVSNTTQQVYLQAGGSVPEYLRLNPPK